MWETQMLMELIFKIGLKKKRWPVLMYPFIKKYQNDWLLKIHLDLPSQVKFKKRQTKLKLTTDCRAQNLENWRILHSIHTTTTKTKSIFSEKTAKENFLRFPTLRTPFPHSFSLAIKENKNIKFTETLLSALKRWKNLNTTKAMANVFPFP